MVIVVVLRNSGSLVVVDLILATVLDFEGFAT